MLHKFFNACLVMYLAVALAACDDQSVGNSTTPQPGSEGTGAAQPQTIYLDQGLNADDRLAFYYLSQGSQLLPYYWFLALETAADTSLFRANENMRKLGYIPGQQDANLNPDGLPIGFVKNDDPKTVSYAIKKQFLGPNYDTKFYPPTNAWLGFTCANCHTSEIEYQDKVIRIEGGASLSDHEAFLDQLLDALRATVVSSEKMSRFAHRILDSNWNAGEQDALQQRVEAYIPVLEAIREQNKTALVYGPGRLDAFGAIFNRVLVTGLEKPENHFPSNAPVSFPFLWDTPRLLWVQYNSLAGSPIARNTGEVLGVYAHMQLLGTPETGQFDSTVKLDNLDRLEGYVSQLKAPAWPAEILGEIDAGKVASGEKIYRQTCMKCHFIRDESGEFPMISDAESGAKFITTTNTTYLPELGVEADKVLLGTDPTMVVNAIAHKVDPGVLKPLLPEALQGMEKAPRGAVLQAAVRGVIGRKLSETGLEGDELQQLVLRLNGERVALRSPPPAILKTYKARPLNGIWATAPYLHNGSVPNLYQLLLQDEQRVKTFKVGSRQFDPVNVGYITDQGFLFDTQLPGNLNRGHNGPDFTQLQAEDGSYRDFTHDERLALLEYIKTLN